MEAGMFSEYSATDLLKRIARDHSTPTQQEFDLLGEIIRRYYPADAPLSKQYEGLVTGVQKRNRSKNKGETALHERANLSGIKDEIRELAGTAEYLLTHFPPTRSSEELEHNRREALHLVDSAFHTSALFNAAKWVLLIALALIGAGSLGIAGFNLVISDRIQKVNQELANIEGKRNELKEAQAKALKEVTNAINNQMAETQQAFQAQLNNLKRELSSKLEESDRWVAEQKERFEKSVGAVTNAAKVAVTKSGDDGAAEITTTARAKIAELNTALERQEAEFKTAQKKLVDKTGEVVGFVDSLKSTAAQTMDVATQAAVKSVENAGGESTRHIAQKGETEIGELAKLIPLKLAELEAAQRELTEKTANFSHFIDDQKKQSEERMEPAIEGAMRAIAVSGDAGARTIIQETDNHTRNLNQLADRKETDIETAAQRNVSALDQALAQKLPEVNSKSIDVTDKLELIVSETAAHEQSFVSNMNTRLATWDRSVDTKQRRLEDLENRLQGLDTNQSELSGLLQGLVKNSQSALAVANKLSQSTASGRLEIIGAILERSALYVGSAFAAGAIGFLLSAIALFLAWRWHRQTAGHSRPA
jgi:hypothetical protein